ncbi:endonuclease [Maribacter phage Panino]
MGYNRSKGKSIVGGRKKRHPFKGVDYKSGLEKNMAIFLDAAGISFKYEPKVFKVMDSFYFPLKSYERQANGKGDMVNRGEKKILGISYTPDFIGDGFIIETKGYSNETFPIRWKLFKQLLTKENYNPDDLVIYKPQKISECEEVIKLIKKFRNERK